MKIDVGQSFGMSSVDYKDNHSEMRFHRPSF